MPTITIYHHTTEAILYTGEAATLSAALIAAHRAHTDLVGADLRGADLVGADLRGADLRGADLVGANLREADLRGANLRGANLSGADLRRANLRGANLRGANLTEADLTEADLWGARLWGTRLKGATLAGARLPDAPRLPHLDQRILAAMDAGGRLDMTTWHSCATTHCRAGWAIHLAGAAGQALEDRYGASVAGALIYQASTGRVPDFYATDAEALADLRACAAQDAQETHP